jgi:hypothetical protein
VHPNIVAQLAKIAQSQPGDCFLKLMLFDSDEKMVVETIARKCRIQPTNNLIEQLASVEGISYKLIWQ